MSDGDHKYSKVRSMFELTLTFVYGQYSPLKRQSLVHFNNPGYIFQCKGISETPSPEKGNKLLPAIITTVKRSNVGKASKLQPLIPLQSHKISSVESSYPETCDKKALWLQKGSSSSHTDIDDSSIVSSISLGNSLFDTAEGRFSILSGLSSTFKS